MLKKSNVNIVRRSLLKHIIIGAVMGGILGAVPGFRDLFLLGRPYNTAAAGIFMGIILGGCIGGVIQLLTGQETNIKQPQTGNGTNPLPKIQLHEERLDISKTRVKTGDVAMHKELLTEEKTFTVPVTREDLVIEKMSYDGKSPESVHKETVRIPICEEHVEINKHPVMLEDVEINSRKYEEAERIEATLKKEQPHIEKIGNIKVIESEKKD